MCGISLDDVTKVIGHIENGKHKFTPGKRNTPYYHMGATITDAILQAGLNYRHVVYPRVATLRTKFADYRTTSDFLILIQTIPLRELISWKNEQKIDRITELSWILYQSEIENEDQLLAWLRNTDNVLALSRIKGIGPKTLDYLKMLSGDQAIAIDRHLFRFLEMAGVCVKTYNEANSIYCQVAEKLRIDRYELDKKIWMYMSNTRA